jgi:hypothetical protein
MWSQFLGQQIPVTPCPFLFGLMSTIRLQAYTVTHHIAWLSWLPVSRSSNQTTLPPSFPHWTSHSFPLHFFSPWKDVRYSGSVCSFPFLLFHYLLLSALYRYLAGDLRNVALSFLGTTNTHAPSKPVLKQPEVQAAQEVSQQLSNFHPIVERTKDLLISGSMDTKIKECPTRKLSK